MGSLKLGVSWSAGRRHLPSQLWLYSWLSRSRSPRWLSQPVKKAGSALFSDER